MKNDTQFVGIIPARYASSRFPGKPLALIGGKPMIRLVYEQAVKSLDVVCVATDDERIYDAVEGFGGKAVMTSADHQSGTDRCAEAVEILAKKTGIQADVVINIQGDEPFIRPEQIDLLKTCFTDRNAEIATLVREVNPEEDLFNPNQPKVIIGSGDYAIYFSRAAIPYLRGVDMKDWSATHVYYKHIGIYAYRSDTLKLITKLKQGILEKAESLEQNRWIENGFRIKTALTPWENIGIDTPEDLEKARHFLI